MDQQNENSESAEHASEVKDQTENMTEVKALGFVQRVVGVFVSPGETFAHLDRKPDWLTPMILIVAVSVVSTIFVLPVAMSERMGQQEEMMLDQGMTREQVDQAMQVGEFFGKTMGFVFAFIGPGIGILLVALLLWFVGNVILSGQAPYMKVFSVCTYTSLIGLLETIIKTPLMVMKGSVEVQLNCSVFLPEDQAQTLLHHVLVSLDIFAIWRFAVLAIGLAAIYRFSLKKTGWTMVVLFLIRMGFIVALAQVAARFIPQQ